MLAKPPFSQTEQAIVIASNPCAQRAHKRFSSILRDVRGDIERYVNSTPENIARGNSRTTRLSALLRPELICLCLHRVAHWLHACSWNRAAIAVARFNLLLHKANLSPQSCIGMGCRLPHPPGVVFHGQAGDDLTLFSMAVCIPREDNLDGPLDNAPRLGDRVLLGGHSVIQGPVNIGDDVTIEYCVGVDEDVAPGTLVARRLRKPTFRSVR